MSFDLASTDSLARNLEIGIDIDIKHPVSNQPIGLKMKITGFDSDRIKAFRRALRDERLRNPNRVLTAQQIEADELRQQVTLVLGWSFSDGLVIDGKVPDYTPANVEMMFRRFPWIAEQVEAAATDRARFLTS